MKRIWPQSKAMGLKCSSGAKSHERSRFSLDQGNSSAILQHSISAEIRCQVWELIGVHGATSCTWSAMDRWDRWKWIIVLVESSWTIILLPKVRTFDDAISPFRTPYRAFIAELVYDRIVPEVIHPIFSRSNIGLIYVYGRGRVGGATYQRL